MNPQLIGGIIGGGVGLAKSRFVDAPAAKRRSEYEAMMAKWSPYTGQQANFVPAPDKIGTAMQYGMTGAGLGQNYQQNKDDNKFRSDYLKMLSGKRQEGEVSDQELAMLGLVRKDGGIFKSGGVQ